MESFCEFIVVMKSVDYFEKKNNVLVCIEGVKDKFFYEIFGN